MPGHTTYLDKSKARTYCMLAVGASGGYLILASLSPSLSHSEEQPTDQAVLLEAK